MTSTTKDVGDGLTVMLMLTGCRSSFVPSKTTLEVFTDFGMERSLTAARHKSRVPLTGIFEQFSACFRCLLIPSVPNDFTGAISGNRHY